MIETSAGCRSTPRWPPTSVTTASVTASSSRSATGSPSRPSETRRICDAVGRSPVRPLLGSERHGGHETLPRLGHEVAAVPAGDVVRDRAGGAPYAHQTSRRRARTWRAPRRRPARPPSPTRRPDGRVSPAPPRRSARRRRSSRRRPRSSVLHRAVDVDAPTARLDVSRGGVDECTHAGDGRVEDRPSCGPSDLAVGRGSAASRAPADQQAAVVLGEFGELRHGGEAGVVGVGGVDAPDERVDQPVVDLEPETCADRALRSSRRDPCVAGTARRRRAACPSSSAVMS